MPTGDSTDFVITKLVMMGARKQNFRKQIVSVLYVRNFSLRP